MSGAFGLPTGPRNDYLRHVTENKLALHIGEKTFVVTLYANPTAHDLLTHLPLTLKANDYPGYDEKVIRLPNVLSMQDAPRGDNPEIPEVGYYHPGRCAHHNRTNNPLIVWLDFPQIIDKRLTY